MRGDSDLFERFLNLTATAIRKESEPRSPDAELADEATEPPTPASERASEAGKPSEVPMAVQEKEEVDKATQGLKNEGRDVWRLLDAPKEKEKEPAKPDLEFVLDLWAGPFARGKGFAAAWASRQARLSERRRLQTQASSAARSAHGAAASGQAPSKSSRSPEARRPPADGRGEPPEDLDKLVEARLRFSWQGPREHDSIRQCKTRLGLSKAVELGLKLLHPTALTRALSDQALEGNASMLQLIAKLDPSTHELVEKLEQRDAAGGHTASPARASQQKAVESRVFELLRPLQRRDERLCRRDSSRQRRDRRGGTDRRSRSRARRGSSRRREGAHAQAKDAHRSSRRA